MFVCVCSAIRESQVRQARDAGAQSADEIFAALEAEPCCRRCVPDMDRILCEGRGSAACALCPLQRSA